MIEQPPVHRIAGVDVLGNGEVHEIDRRDERYLAGAHIRLVDDRPHSAPVVGMGMGIDHRRDRQPLADMLLEQRPGGTDGLKAHQRVEHDPAGLAANKGDVGQVEAAHLIDAGDHLIEAVIVVEPRLAVQRRMDAVELLRLVEELEALHVPGDMAGVGHDLQFRHWRDEALLLLFEVPLIGEGQGPLGAAEEARA